MKLYNSESRTVEEFIPRNNQEVTFYSCGPTVYHYAHIGNLRSYIMHDVLEKALRFLGYNVKRALNITDVGHLSNDSDDGEDKMVKSANEQNKSVLEIAQFYTQAFKSDTEKLNLKWPEIVVPATSMIDKYIEMITVLLDKGYAYKSGDNIYFDISKLDNYYRFGNQASDDMLVGARDNVDGDDDKRNPADFVLWFTKSKFENHALSWDSPWGRGYPGWHIECSGISHEYFGEYLDIHSGGVDNKFPHHTNEIAQTEAYVGHPWCKYWFHVEHLNDKSGKMSKSKGDFLTLDRIARDGYSPMMYKYFCLCSHYRKQLVYSEEGMQSAKSAYTKLIEKIAKLEPNSEEINLVKFDEYYQKFAAALSNDLNTSLAITCVYDALKDTSMNDATKVAVIVAYDEVLGLDFDKALYGNHEILQKKEETSEVDAGLEEYILAQIELRKQAKKDKDFVLADRIRAELLERGVELVDTREGTTYKIIQD